MQAHATVKSGFKYIRFSCDVCCVRKKFFLSRSCAEQKRNRLSQDYTKKFFFVHQNLKLSDSKHVLNVSEQPTATSSLQACLQ